MESIYIDKREVFKIKNKDINSNYLKVSKQLIDEIIYYYYTFFKLLFLLIAYL